MIAQTIQLALAPVFVLVAMGNILNILSTRLGRVVDRARVLQNAHMATEGMEHDLVVAEIRMIDRRIVLITHAVRLMVLTGLTIGATVALLVTKQKLEDTLSKIEWPTLFFFLALFVGERTCTTATGSTPIRASRVRSSFRCKRPSVAPSR